MAEEMLAAQYIGGEFDSQRKGGNVILSNNNLTAALGNQGEGVFGTTSKSSGKWYLEFVINQNEGTNQTPMIGIVSPNAELVKPWGKGVGLYLLYSYDAVAAQYIDKTTYYELVRINNIVSGSTVAIEVDFSNDRVIFKVRNIQAFSLRLSTQFGQSPVIYPMVCSSGRGTGNSIVTWRKEGVLYRPSGYSLW